MESNTTFGSNNSGVQIGAYLSPSENKSERQNITDWLSPIDFHQKQQDVYADHESGTGQWFLDLAEFRAWKEGENNVLWCQGIPGSGKTVITSIIVEHLRQSQAKETNLGVAPIYCEYKLKELQTPANLLSSIWRQLSLGQDSMSEEAIALYAKHHLYRTKPTIDEIILIVQTEIRRHAKVFIVVDALDECPEDDRIRATFIAKLRHILIPTASSESNVRILVTSRLANNVFSNASEIEIRATDDDLKHFVCQRIKNGLSDDDDISDSIRQNQSLKNDLVTMIVERAGKMFLIARLQLGSLATKTTLRSLREAAKSLPKNLDELYLEAWNRITNQNTDSQQDAQEAVCWLTCSFRQLRVQELRHAIATEQGDKVMDEENLMNFDRLVRSCAGLVTVDRGSQIVRLVHQTAQDFFEQRAGKLFPDAHTRLARKCITYLHFDEFSQGPCEFGSSSDLITMKGPIAASKLLRTRLARNPFMKYAADHWGDHARGEALERTLEGEVLGFLRSRMTLASSVQAQYWDAKYRRSLHCSKHTPIHVAVSFALEYIIGALLRDGVDLELNAEDRGKRTAFHWAVESGLAGCARLLLAAGVDIRTQDKEGNTALYKATAFGYGSVVKMILEYDRTVKLTKEEINCAVLSNQTLVIEAYVRTALEPVERANLILMKSSVFGKPDIIKLAISLGAEANFEDGDGHTALLLAVLNGRSTAVQALVAAGALTTVLDDSGRTLLQVAASSQKIFQERFDHIRNYGDSLAERGSRSIHQLPVHIADDPRQKILRRLSSWIESTSGPLTCLAKDPGFIEAMNEDDEHPDIIRLLIDSGADLEIKTAEGETILHLAVGSASRVNALLEKGAQVLDIDSRDNQGRSALHHAVAIGNSAAMEILLANGANVELRDFCGASILHYAVNTPACVKIALEGGISTEAVDFKKRTALHYFAMMEDSPREVFDQLYEAGANPGAIDFQGTTASYILEHPDLGRDEFGETSTTDWIDAQLYSQRYVLQPANIFFYLRESTEQAGRDNLRFFERISADAERSRTWWIVPDDQIPTSSTG